MEDHCENSLLVSFVQEEQPEPLKVAPIISSYNEQIRPVLDALESLRRLNITKEGIQLPTIVVVGDQSSGKSSVLESLAGISLPRGQGICTRVPLIMRLQNHPLPEPQLVLEFHGKTKHTDIEHVSEAISEATDDLAGTGKAISNNPLTLLVKKDGVPDLTMVDLPGITRVPVHGQPENIYEQIRDIIMEYITPEESIILNVISATVDFSTSESIRMSQIVDKKGERTLAVVTKADKAPEGLLDKVTADDVNIGLGYVCVRNRVGQETYEEARTEEAELFERNPLLSQIDKSIVGIPVLAQKLVHLQATSIAKILPEIVKKIDQRLSSSVSELDHLPKSLTSVAEAMAVVMRIIGSAKESLGKILLRADLDECLDDKRMHCTARLVEMINKCSEDLYAWAQTDTTSNFLMEEIEVLEETKRIALPNFMPYGPFLSLLKKKVTAISSIPVDCIGKIWEYLEDVVLAVLKDHSKNYPHIQMSIRRAGKNVIAKRKEGSKKHVALLLEMEKLTGYTSDPAYISEFNKLMSKEQTFMSNVHFLSKMSLEGIGEVQICDQRKHGLVLPQAFGLKMRMIAYWKIVLRRLIDCVAMHLQFSINSFVNKELEDGILCHLQAPHEGGIEKFLGESPSVAVKREKLNRSIQLLKDGKGVLANIMDTISGHGDY